jgi:hypothetical protein
MCDDVTRRYEVPAITKTTEISLGWTRMNADLFF